MTIKRFAQHAWDAGGGQGLFGHPGEGLGIGLPFGGGQGIPHSTRLPPGHQGHGGNLTEGPQSGNNVVDHALETGVFDKKKLGDFTVEELMKKIKALMKIKSPESMQQAVFLQDVLRDKMQRLKAARRAFDAHALLKNASIVRGLKEDPFTQALFEEHNVPLDTLDDAVIPAEITHFSLHNLVHKIAQVSATDVLDELTERVQQELSQELSREELEQLRTQVAKEVAPAQDYSIGGEAWNLLSMIDQRIKEVTQESREVSSELIEQLYKDLQNLSFDQWPAVVQRYKEAQADNEYVAETIQEAVYETLIAQVDTRTGPWANREDVPHLSQKSLEQFYAVASILVPYLDRAERFTGVITRIVDLVSGVAETIMVGTRGGIVWHLVGGMSARVDEAFPVIAQKIKDDDITGQELVSAAQHWLGDDDSWTKVAKAYANIERHIPINVGNLAQAIHDVHIALHTFHHGGLILGDYVPVMGSDGKRMAEEDVFELLDDKTQKWDDETVKEKAPQIWQLVENLKRRAYLEALKKFSQTAQPIKGKCPESGETRYMSQSDLVQNDYKADCPEGKRKLKDQKSVSIEDYKKHKKKEKSKKKKEAQVAEVPTDIAQQNLQNVQALAEALKTQDWNRARQLYLMLPPDVQGHFANRIRNQVSQGVADYIIEGVVTPQRERETSKEPTQVQMQRPYETTAPERTVNMFLEMARNNQWDQAEQVFHVLSPDSQYIVLDALADERGEGSLKRALEYTKRGEWDKAEEEWHNLPDEYQEWFLEWASEQQLPSGAIRPEHREYSPEEVAEALKQRGMEGGAYALTVKDRLGGNLVHEDKDGKRHYGIFKSGPKGVLYNIQFYIEPKMRAVQLTHFKVSDQLRRLHDPDLKITPEIEEMRRELPNPMEVLSNTARQYGYSVQSPKMLELMKQQGIKGLMKQAQEQQIKFNDKEQKIINAVKEAAEDLNKKVYLVGGAVRDRLLGKENVDLDFMVEKGAEELVAHLADKYNTEMPVQYDRSKALMITLDDETLDFINAEKLFRPLKRDESLEGEEEYTVSFDDAYRRDLTINTLMYDIRTGELIDPTGKGLEDLRDKQLNTVIDPFIKYKIHAPDMLRALRFAATLGFELGPNMIEAMRANVERVRPRDKGGDISNRRIRKELRKAADDPEHWATMRQLLSEAGLDSILADDIDDVQQDIIGGIEYHLEESAMTRIRGFCKKAAEDISKTLDKMLEEQGINPETGQKMTQLERQRRQEPRPGMWEKMKGVFTKKPSGPLTPEMGGGRIGYLQQKLDDVLARTARENHDRAVQQFFAQYPKLTKEEQLEIMSRLRNYRPSISHQAPSKEIKWRD